MKKWMLALATLGVLVYGLALADSGAKNLKVLPKTMTKVELKKLMKKMSSSLGVECDHCHNKDDMSVETEKKEEAREMMIMVDEINKRFFKGKPEVSCFTCHNGRAEPKK
ncbi:MAG: c-type cytochrome [Deltaproteobacteria bacterium]|nr:c-type cytochrome [Deltaproteobacteria bacterium]